MGIDIVDLVDIITGLGITPAVPVVKAFLNCYFAAIPSLACMWVLDKGLIGSPV